jgi:hypothetical protein
MREGVSLKVEFISSQNPSNDFLKEIRDLSTEERMRELHDSKISRKSQRPK